MTSGGGGMVSCLMVTAGAPESRGFLARSLDSYCRQTYPNRELIVVPDGPPEGRAALAEAVGRLGRRDVSIRSFPEGHSRNALRNLGLEGAAGDLVCQWSDDALYHPQRIERQAAPLLTGSAAASLLSEHFSLSEEERRLALIDWRSTLMKGHPATLMLKRDLGLRYPEQSFREGGDDTSLFYQLVRKELPIAVVGDRPELFVHRFVGGDGAAWEHYRKFVARCGRPAEELLADQERLSVVLREVLLEEDVVELLGGDGAAFKMSLAPPAGDPHPMVSCLMITAYAPARRELLVRSLESYCRQTYEKRELVVISDGPPDDQDALAAILAGLGRKDVFLTLLPERRSLGALRNLSLERARGEIVCQWDDDDLYHPRRIEVQVAPIAAGKVQATLLGGHFSYFQPERRLGVIDWRNAIFKGHPGTLMMRRDLGVRYPEEGPCSSRSEDSSVFHQLLRRRVLIATVDDAPELFVYRFHGANTWAGDHHRGLLSRHGRPRADLLANEERLAQGLREVLLEGDTVEVEGRDGTAFSVPLERSVPG